MYISPSIIEIYLWYVCFMGFLISSFFYQVGTDIEDFKCSWLVVKSIGTQQRGTKENIICETFSFLWQRQLAYQNRFSYFDVWFQENYGKPHPEKIAKVKTLYKELDLRCIGTLKLLMRTN